MKRMLTREELQDYDGRNGRPAYVAVNDLVYDVSSSRHWHNGEHAGNHCAGRDLSRELQQAPHVRSVLERFPVVGQLVAETTSSPRIKTTTVAFIAAAVVALILLMLLL